MKNFPVIMPVGVRIAGRVFVTLVKPPLRGFAFDPVQGLHFNLSCYFDVEITLF